MNLNARRQAILLLNFKEHIASAKAKVRTSMEDLKAMAAFQSNNKQHLLKLLQEISEAWDRYLKGLEAEEQVLQDKMNYLVKTEGQNIFAGITAEEMESAMNTAGDAGLADIPV
jgi:hypothetical protein